VTADVDVVGGGVENNHEIDRCAASRLQGSLLTLLAAAGRRRADRDAAFQH
jgi:hypothetical protein